MKSEVVWLVGSIVFGFILGQLTAAYRTRHDFWILSDLTKAQLTSAENQLAQQFAADERRRLIERRNKAYKTLSRWLTELERTVDNVWGMARSADEVEVQRVRAIIDEWAWETLRVPSYASWGDLYWSDEVRSEIRRFKSESANFVARVRHRILEDRPGDEREKATSADTALWEAYGDLQLVINDIRSRAHKDLAAPIIADAAS